MHDNRQPVIFIINVGLTTSERVSVGLDKEKTLTPTYTVKEVRMKYKGMQREYDGSTREYEVVTFLNFSRTSLVLPRTSKEF